MNARSIDWYSEGETRIVDCHGVQVVVKYVNRKGRRARIEIVAPAGAAFSSGDDQDETDSSKL